MWAKDWMYVSIGVLEKERSECRTYPSATVVDETGQAVGSGSSEAWWASDEAAIHHSNLEEVLSQGTDLVVVLISLGDQAEEGHWSWVANAPSKLVEHEALSLGNLLLGESLLNHEADLVKVWWVDLLNLTSDEECGGTNKLKLGEGNSLDRHEAVNDIDGEEEGLWEHLETLVDLNNPIDKDSAVVPHDLLLLLHVVWSWHVGVLKVVSTC